MRKVSFPGGIVGEGRSCAVRVVACCGTMAGPARNENQDAVVVDGVITQHERTVFQWSRTVDAPFSLAVVDGMGGCAGGREAAGLLAMFLSDADFAEGGCSFGGWIDELSARIAAAGRVWDAPDMGAAFALAVIAADGIHFANVGDCCIYHLVGGYAAAMSVDDRPSPASSRLTQAVGGVCSLDSHEYAIPFSANRQRLVLCSDGVWSLLGDGYLLEVCGEGAKPVAAVERVLEECTQKNAADNCTIVVADVLVSMDD